MFVSPYNEGIILVFAQDGQIWSRPQVSGEQREGRKKVQKIRYKLVLGSTSKM